MYLYLRPILISVQSHISLAALNRLALVTTDFRRTIRPCINGRMNKAGRLVSPGFVEQMTSALEAFDWDQEGVGIASPPTSSSEQIHDVRVMPI
jgi:hypothetical protein